MTCFNLKKAIFREYQCAEGRGVDRLASKLHWMRAVIQWSFEDAILEALPTRLREVMLLHDNACPHSANLTKNTIQELGLEVFLHPPYLHDLAPSDFHLLCSLSNNLQGTSFPDENVL